MAERSEVERDKCDAWFKAVREWLRARFDGHLRSVVAHLDEEYPHVHFFMIAGLRSDDLLDWAGIHPGLEAKRMGSLHGETTGTQDARYRVAMRELQDEFYEKVSVHFGHDRYGPKRKRVSRQEDASRQAVAKEREGMHTETEPRKNGLRQKLEAYDHWFDHAKQHFERLLAASMIRLKPPERELLLGQYRRAMVNYKNAVTAPSQVLEPKKPDPY